jgi:hypothetical protein
MFNRELIDPHNAEHADERRFWKTVREHFGAAFVPGSARLYVARDGEGDPVYLLSLRGVA